MEYTIYKIVCKDENIKDCYVGSTNNFNRRQKEHKSCYNNELSVNYNYDIYNFIRNNGNFDNFKFEIIETINCENKNEAFIRERYWIEKLQSSLNKNIPSRTKKEANKEWCNKIGNEYWINVRQNRQHIINQKYNCICGGKYTYSSKSHHLKTNKHKNYLASLPNLELAGSY